MGSNPLVRGDEVCFQCLSLGESRAYGASSLTSCQEVVPVGMHTTEHRQGAVPTPVRAAFVRVLAVRNTGNGLVRVCVVGGGACMAA